MLLKRFYHEGLAQASYLVGCQRTGDALVVDANRDLAPYITAAAENGFRITHVTETHIHADYLSGSRELAELVGATLLLSGEGGTDWQYVFARDAQATLLHDGDSFSVGNIRIDVVHTPGHTPEHLTFVVTDTVASDRPVGALTGDFIFVGDVGRPDLLERAAGIEGTMRAGAKLLFESLRRFTEHYPDYLQLWPGHGSGSACGKALGAVPQSTLGYEKLVNWAFQLDNEKRFVESVLEGQPDPPTYFATMKRMNREGPARLGGLPAPARLQGSALEDVLARGGLVVDVRRADRHAEGGVPGTINIPLNRGFVGYAGWLLPYDRDIHLLADGDDASVPNRAAAELAMIGLDRVVGWFGGDAIATWQAGGRALRTLGRIAPPALAARRASARVSMVDVRSESEWNTGHIAGSVLIPLGKLRERAGELPRDVPTVVICQTGSRSAIGASVLATEGIADVANLVGGVVDWERAGFELEGAPALTTS